MIWWVIAGGILITALTALPIGVGLGLTGLAVLHFVVGDAMLLAVPAVWNVFTDFTFSAVPLFILMGEVLLESGLSRRIYDGIAPFFNRLPGGLLHSNIAVCAVFGSISGGSMTTAAAVGSVAYPELVKKGYEPRRVVATLAAGGTLGLLIPPSLSLLIYGATMQVSIGQLFLAGLLPGVLLALGMMVIVALTSSNSPHTRTEAQPLAERLRGLFGLWPVAVLIVAVLGTIYTGLATTVEAAGLGAAASIFLGLTWGNLTLRLLWRATAQALRTFSTIGMVILGALILAQGISVTGLPGDVIADLSDLGVHRYVVLFGVVLIYLLLGCFFDGLSLMLMTLPIVFPMLTSLHFDPVWLGVMITILIEIGALTPPVGLNLFVLVAISQKQVSLGEASWATLPYWLVLLFGVFLLTALPDIALILPNTFMR